MNIPKNHHFLPKMFINRFSKNSDEKVFVYNKIFNKIYTKPKHSSTICYVEHLYSLDSRSGLVSLLENTFAKFEGEWKKVFDKLDGDLWVANTLLKHEVPEKMLRLFYACQFWRSPTRDELVKSNARKLLIYFDSLKNTEDLIFPIERVDLEFFIENMSSSFFFKIVKNFLFPIMTYAIPFKDGFSFRLLDKEGIYASDLICPDVGVSGCMLEDVFQSSKLKILPFSKNRLLLISKENSFINSEIIVESQYDLLMSASEFVFSSSTEGLSQHATRYREEFFNE